MLPKLHPEVHPDELLVKAEYFLPIEPKEENLRKLKDEFRLILQQDGYYQVDQELSLFGPSHRTMTFKFHFNEPEPPRLWKIKNRLGLASKGDLSDRYEDHIFHELEKRRQDLPFEIDLRFHSISTDDSEGYRASVTVIPTLLQQYKQRLLNPESDVDVKTVVTTTKREIERVFDKIEAHPFRRPYTEAEVLESDLTEGHRESLAETEYGRTALLYFDEAEVCLQRKLLRAGLNCYILAIEWVIIAYLNEERGRDIIAEEKANTDSRDLGYWNLLDILDGDKQVSQITISKLRSMNYGERSWMAHHKDGKLLETDVVNVKERLEILIRELYPQLQTEEPKA